jgi:hypothetical protein
MDNFKRCIGTWYPMMLRYSCYTVKVDVRHQSIRPLYTVYWYNQSYCLLIQSELLSIDTVRITVYWYSQSYCLLIQLELLSIDTVRVTVYWYSQSYCLLIQSELLSIDTVRVTVYWYSQSYCYIIYYCYSLW